MSIIGAITPQMTLARILAMSKEKIVLSHVSIQICSFVAPCRRPILIATPLPQSLTWCTSQRRETLDRTDFHSDPPAYPGRVDRRTSGIIFLGRTERHLIENFHVRIDTDEVFEAWTRATQIVRPNCCHPAGDGAFLGSWVRRNHLRCSDRGDEAKPVELLSRVRQQRAVVPGSC
jgi:hypothetical protein